MKKIFLLLPLLVLVACDDGDIITTDFDFEDVAVSACTPIASGNTANYIFYKNSSANSEALLLSFDSTSDIATEGFADSFEINTSNIFEYRRFNMAATADYFCGFLPPTEPAVVEIYEGTSGTIVINTIRIDDDEDGIPSFLEMDADGNELDSDGDGIPNYLDIDDDGDNVPTSEEGVVFLNGEISLRDSQDTDGDGTLDYLDEDDDEDGVLTKQEATVDDISPLNYPEPGTRFPNYLNSNVADAAQPEVVERIPHTYWTALEIDFEIRNLNFTNGSEVLIYEVFDFGQIEVQRTEIIVD
ncbi:MAG: hypothetical protein WBG46_13265 [Nonlabens sp.]